MERSSRLESHPLGMGCGVAEVGGWGWELERGEVSRPETRYHVEPEHTHNSLG